MQEKVLSQEEEMEEKYETGSGIPIKDIYRPEDIRHIDYERDIGEAGEYPHTRGIYKGMYRNKLWTRRFLSGFGSAEDSMERLKYLAGIGSEGVEVINDTPGQLGLDSDHPMAVDEVGLVGMPATSLDDLETILEGFPLDKTVASFEASGASSFTTFCQLIALAEKQGVPLTALNGSIHPNPFDTYYCSYGTLQPLDLMTKLAVDVVQFCSEKKMRFVTFHGSARLARENGITACQELALGMSTQIAFVEKLLERGLKFDDIAYRPVFTFGICMDFFEEIAKFRAGRKMWARIAREKYGSKNPRAQRLYLAVRASGRALIAQQPLNNITRTAYQLMAAVLGGCNAIDPCLLDEPLCLPTEDASWIGMCNQNILAHETGVYKVVDPLGGSYFIEYLTDELEKKAFKLLDKIQEMGGITEAVRTKWVDQMIEEESLKFQRAVEKGEIKLVGANDMVLPPEKEQHLPIHRTTRASSEKQIRRTIEVKQRRDNKKVKELLKKLIEEDKRGNVNLVPTAVEASKAYATIGEIWGTLREGRGLSYDPHGMIESPFKD